MFSMEIRGGILFQKEPSPASIVLSHALISGINFDKLPINGGEAKYEASHV
jgi:hypothetical protein